MARLQARDLSEGKRALLAAGPPRRPGGLLSVGYDGERAAPGKSRHEMVVLSGQGRTPPGCEPHGISSTIHVWVRWCRIESSVAAILVALLVASRIASFLPRQKKCAVMNMMSRPWSLLYSRIAICGHRFRCDCAQAGAAVPANRSRLRVDNVHSAFHVPVAWCV